MAVCAAENTIATDQSSFWNSNGADWDAHRIGWAVAGGCTVITVLISTFSVLSHARHYTCPAEQRQILRILYMPPIYAIISFFSYRFFRSYTYYELIEVVYEAVTISAFLLLIIEFVASTGSGHSTANALSRKDKRPLPIPFCCWRYRPTKAYFMYTIKWIVLQYVVFRPLVSVAAIVCQHFGVLCEDGGFNIHFAYAYLEAVDFVSITVALYGLIVFYGLTRAELEGRRPLAKFLCIKLIVMATFYQSFVFSELEGRVIKPTQYWTTTNIANGLNALTICIEMIFFALGMLWAYPASEYKKDGRTTSIWRPLWDSVNYTDFVREIWGSLMFFVRGVPPARGKGEDARPDFGEVFGVAPPPYSSAGGYEAKPVAAVQRFRGGRVGDEDDAVTHLTAPRADGYYAHGNASPTDMRTSEEIGMKPLGYGGAPRGAPPQVREAAGWRDVEA